MAKKKPAKAKPPIYQLGDDVVITWRDCAAGVGWTRERPGLHTIISSGFLVREAPDALTLASTVDLHNAAVNRFEVIPRGCITNVRVRERNSLAPEFWL